MSSRRPAIGNKPDAAMRTKESTFARMDPIRFWSLLSGVGNRFFVRFGGVLVGLGRVLVRFRGMLVCLLVVARLMVRRGFVMVLGCLLVMLCCFVVCFDCHV